MRFEFSAGGIVLRQAKDKFKNKKWEVLVAQHSQHHGWVFPKGLIDQKSNPSTSLGVINQKSKIVRETKEEAAIREVREETGVLAKIIEPLTPVSYWYNFEGEKIKKTVYYFLMEYMSGDIKEHDFEMENVEWLPIDKIEDRLTYKSDREAWKETGKILNIKD